MDLYSATILLIFLANLGIFECCDMSRCPRLECDGPVMLPGECCPKCPCPVNGFHYSVGDLVPTDNKCEMCECTKWGVMCLPMPCPPPDCPNPILMDGECCPECGCLGKRRRLYEIGQAMPVPRNDPCIIDCRCGINGERVCERTECPPAFCYNPKKVPWECCPVCGCTFGVDQDFYYVGEEMPYDDDDPCIISCRCELNGQRFCERKQCPMTDCPKPLHPPGECCTTCGCLDERNQRLFDIGQEMPYDDDDPCILSCSCGLDGQRVCERNECPMTDCPKPLHLPGECCEKCGCLDEQNQIVFYIGEEMPYEDDDPCILSCRCGLNGQKDFERKECPSTDCPNPLHFPGECCDKCGCLDDHNQIVYNIGEEMPYDDDDPCILGCRCGLDGQRIFERKECPVIECPEPLDLPGECCEKCGCLDEQNQRVYGIGEDMPYDDDDPCILGCRCGLNGQRDCERKDCPIADCPNPLRLPGECCEKCGCQLEENEMVFNIGEEMPYDDDDPCIISCHCGPDGQRVFERMECPMVQCPKPLHLPGECCQTCGCQLEPNGRVYEIGEAMPYIDDDPCIIGCSCGLNGQRNFETTECPLTDCPERLQLPGECCEKCVCMDEQTKLLYDIGEEMPYKDDDPCILSCLCGQNGQRDCQRKECPMNDCLQPMYLPGECCGTCGCLYEQNQKVYDIGEEMPYDDTDLCILSCRCGQDGQRLCERKECPILDCPKPLHLPGECCEKCGCLDEQKQSVYEIGEEMPYDDEDPCILSCRCGLTGQKVFERKECPVTDCPNPLYFPGECCAKCGCLFEENQKVYNIGEEMPYENNDPCILSCRCGLNGQRDCQKQDCPITGCPKPLHLPGECCEKCGCQLEQNQRVYEIGEKMPYDNDDPCILLSRCGLNGQRVYERKECPTADCPNPLYFPGECCGKCGCLFEQNQRVFDIGEEMPYDKEDPCILSSHCGLDGQRVYERKECPKTDCPNPLYFPGVCCGMCGCLDEQNQRLFAIGEEMPYDDDDPCILSSHCELNGQRVFKRKECPVTDCLNPLHFPGKCCEKCGCLDERKQRVYEIGQAVPDQDNDPCISSCRCTESGEIVCDRIECPVLSCSFSVTLPGQCCSECRCVLGENNTQFEVGELMPLPADNLCTKLCRCGADGERACEPRDCPLLDCTEQEILPGNCCPSCGPHPQFGEVVPLTPEEEKDPCILRCRYDRRGEKVCKRVECPKPKCPEPVHLPGECCQICGCYVGQNNTFYKEASIVSENQCQICTCEKDGTVDCILKVSCPKMRCKVGEYIPDGQCCPECQCEYEGQATNPGLVVDNGCKTCICLGNGTVSCKEKVTCPELKCRYGQYQHEDECCPKCQCKYDGEIRVPGLLYDDGCKKCTCLENGTVSCLEMVTCQEVKCKYGIYQPEGECCPKCKCKYKGDIKLPGLLYDDGCKACTCLENGTVSCIETVACPKVKCKYGKYKPEGECCSLCKCRYRGRSKLPGEEFGTVCEPCICNGLTGKSKCTEPECSNAVNCVNPRVKHGECCPSCPDGPNCMIGKTIIKYGEYKEIGSKVCTCAGETWYPDAFCANKSVSYSVYINFREFTVPYGFKGENKQ